MNSLLESTRRVLPRGVGSVFQCLCFASLAGVAAGQAASVPGFPAEAAESGTSAHFADWPAHGRTPYEQRYSPLTQVDRTNVTRVGMAWQTPLDSARGLEATPIVVDGVLYVTSTWSRVFALDAKTGKPIWQYDPQVPREWGKKGCCDVVNRGVAVTGDKVLVGTFDGRLVALDKADGAVIWEVNTIDRSRPYTITGAPRVVKDKVVIGNGGADYGVRGYFSAYDVESGDLAWRFYTVPADYTGPFEHPELEAAAKTWDPDSLWDIGGGGTVWDSMAYDADLDLLYVGTGNGSPWPRFLRSPAGGDNLYLSSILAVDPDTGRLAWHYQTTPGDSWDYTATQHIVLADVLWEAEPRKVLMQAPKNGFFYVLDRATGELLAADKYVRVTWASHVDMKTGRPVMTELADYSEEGTTVFPSTLGGHNWHPMSFNPQTGLVYIPAQEAATYFSPEHFSVLLASEYRKDMEHIVPDPILGFAVLTAWDPVERGVKWRVTYPAFSNAGVLSTAGGLVVQGDAQGFMNFYDADTGQRLHRIETGTGIIAPPITYKVDGEQYIAVAAGWGGALFSHAEQPVVARRLRNDGRLIALKLGGGAVPLPEPLAEPAPWPSGEQVRMLSPEETAGRSVYIAYCGACHGWYGHSGLLPDLRRSDDAIIDNLEVFVWDGALSSRGMPSFREEISEAELDALKSYLRAVRIE